MPYTPALSRGFGHLMPSFWGAGHRVWSRLPLSDVPQRQEFLNPLSALQGRPILTLSAEAPEAFWLLSELP